MPTFLKAYQNINTCAGGIVSTTEHLEALRFCNIVQGSLTINVGDESADFNALHDISMIRGWKARLQNGLVTMHVYSIITMFH
jgi:hypothetical protein